MNIDEIFALFFMAFIWLIAPSIIIHYKGRRWWAWLPIALFLPGAFLIIAIFMHGANKDGKNTIS
ncbi:hypothetical protein [Yoonia vestfoldensis]|nr:hypothetical protein [Yoonia vestfoldensis]